ncbi:predicted protein [Pediculus humanus corporis]|uniref:Predicted protein n=1 Tax=Pediculus humanus subsp. corporis TaxID=121224 RepID=E0VRU1_PEDHC|nr:uncharacterized protein Phum_PHUM404600 [Pediculus humanus corporis]EEB16097.1 predicted protein [Pediculus humanus corporis]
MIGTYQQQIPVKNYFLNETYNNSQNISVILTNDDVTLKELEKNFIKSHSHHLTSATDDGNYNKIKPKENDDVVADDKLPFEIDIVTKFLRIVETQHVLGENCTAGTDLNLGEGVVDRYAQERFRVEADVAVNRANMLTRLWKYADPDVLSSEYLLHASVVGMVEFDDDIFAGGNCYDEYQYKDYWLFCPYAFRLPDGPILTKNLAIEYKYITNTSEWFFIARKSAERIIKNHDQLKKGFIAFTYNDTTHKSWMPDEILSVRYEDGKWSKPYYDCGGGNIWMLTYTVPFFGGTSGIDIDLRRVDIDQCPSPPGNAALNIFAGSHKCKKKTTRCEPISGLGFRRGSYKCLCKRGFYHPDTKSEHKYYNGTVVEDEYEKFVMGEENLYEKSNFFECLPCAEGCDFCVDKRPCIASLNWVMRTIILVLSCMIILCLPAILVFTWKYGNVKVVRAASPVLLRFIILGAFFMYCTPIVMYPTPNLGTCTLRVWLREIGFSLTYGALMLKTWRISVIFHVRSAKPVRITDFDLLKRLGMIVGIFCLFLIIRTLVAPPFVITGKTAEDLKAYLCRTDWWDHSFTSLEVLFLIWGIRLCIVVRKAPSEFNESRFISMAIYNEFLLTVFLKVSMLFLRKPANPDLLYIIFFCYTQLTVTLLLCLIFGSKMYIVFRGQGKLEESSSTFSKPQTTTFLVKPKSLSSQQNPSIDSTAVTKQVLSDECEVQEEFLKICIELESIKKTYIKLGNKNYVAKIAAMQEIARKDFTKMSSETSKINPGDNNSGESIKEEKEDEEEEEEEGKGVGNDNRKNKKMGSNCDKVTTIVHKQNCRACGGKVRKSNEDSSSSTTSGSHTQYKKECNLCDKINSHRGGSGGDEKLDGYGKEYTNSNIDRLHSGHAKTHSIVINLDDNSRFTDEVTV